jgi:hypothetical protein
MNPLVFLLASIRLLAADRQDVVLQREPHGIGVDPGKLHADLDTVGILRDVRGGEPCRGDDASLRRVRHAGKGLVKEAVEPLQPKQACRVTIASQSYHTFLL